MLPPPLLPHTVASQPSRAWRADDRLTCASALLRRFSDCVQLRINFMAEQAHGAVRGRSAGSLPRSVARVVMSTARAAVVTRVMMLCLHGGECAPYLLWRGACGFWLISLATSHGCQCGELRCVCRYSRAKRLRVLCSTLTGSAPSLCCIAPHVPLSTDL